MIKKICKLFRWLLRKATMEKQVVTLNVSHRLRARYERNRPHSKTICGKPKEKKCIVFDPLVEVKSKKSHEEGREKERRKIKSNGYPYIETKAYLCV